MLKAYGAQNDFLRRAGSDRRFGLPLVMRSCWWGWLLFFYSPYPGLPVVY